VSVENNYALQSLNHKCAIDCWLLCSNDHYFSEHWELTYF